MFIAAIVKIAKICMQSKWQTTDKWMKKLWTIYTIKYHKVLKQNKTMKCAASWIELEDNILSDSVRIKITVEE